MHETLRGGARIPTSATRIELNEMPVEEKLRADAEVERQELSFRQFFSGDPVAAFTSLHERVAALEAALAGLSGAESRLKAAQEALERRPETVIPDTTPRSVPEEVSSFMRENEAYGDAADRLAKEMSELDNKRFLQIITPEDERKYEALKKVMNWFETKGAVEVL